MSWPLLLQRLRMLLDILQILNQRGWKWRWQSPITTRHLKGKSIGIRFGKSWRCHQSEIKPQVSSEYIFLGCNRWDQNLQGSDPAIFQGNPSEVKDYFAVRSTIGLREGLGRHGMNALMGSNVEVLAVFLCRFVSSLQKIDENSWVQR